MSDDDYYGQDPSWCKECNPGNCSGCLPQHPPRMSREPNMNVKAAIWSLTAMWVGIALFLVSRCSGNIHP